MSYKDIVATVGVNEYEGKKKYITRKVGVLLETDKGLRIKLDASFNPAGCKFGSDGAVWLACFDPKPQEAKKAPEKTKDDEWGDIDF